MSKKYRLLKDLPDYKAGSLIKFNDETGYYQFEEECDDGVKGQWPPRYVDNNPDWFELINERIEVISVRFCILPNENSVEINFDKKIKVSQFPLIKQAIENAINS